MSKQVAIPAILHKGLYYIPENQKEINNYAYDDLISVLFKELRKLLHIILC
jgi:hypothetical protein